ncbi:kinesin-like protein Klp61F [Anoplophora glabripennis]|uniref:kinesin-like protein Klp61F n=1 Tax=Anoplophora glabripennis TaxID=217634 RepID=UPI00087566D4|nr:kinesin-like protein Klp61F [Anoplophora glabripennis]
MAQLLVIPPRKKATVAEKQNIKVVVRVRPLSKQEIDANVKAIIKYLSQKDILAKDKRFQFDRVFKPDSNQIEVYQHVVAPMIPDVVSGYNCTVFAYGQTGSGKTYTMTGNKSESLSNWKEDIDSGIIPRAATHIFDVLPSNRPEKSVKVSYLELYNEEIRDLLCDDDTPLNIYNDMKGSIFIQGLTEVNISDSEGICKQLLKGNIKRQTAPTLMNHQSSRSHTVFTITVFTKESTSSNEEILKTGKINFVDLAGSENIARSGCKDMRAVELANINRSLLTLGRVIHALADKSKKHVPYRDSKLTRILQDSLGGHTKTCIVATISPASNSVDETLSTLEYACRARDIKNSPTVNEKLSQNQIIDSLFNTIKRLELDLEACRNEVGFYISKDNYSTIVEELEALRGDKLSFGDVLKEKNKHIEELESQIKAKNEEYDSTVELCEKSREILDKLEQDIKQKKISLKRERFVSRTYEQEASQLQKEAQDLLKTSEMLSEQTNILQRKLETQYHINKANETNARAAVAKVLDMLNELTEERNYITSMDDKMCRLCQEDIVEFKVALQTPLVTLKNIFENFDRSLIQDLPIKESVLRILKDFLFVTRKQISEMKLKFNVFSDGHRKFSNDVLQFPTAINQVFERFQAAVYNMVTKISDLFNQEDTELFNIIEHLEEEILTRKKEEEIMYEKRRQKDKSILSQINSLKEIISKRQGNREEKLLSELIVLTNESRNEVDKVTENFVGACTELNTNLPSHENLDEVLDEVKKFGENVTSEASKLEELYKIGSNNALETLSKTVISHVQDVTTSINSNYESLNSRIGYMIDDKRQEDNSFIRFIKSTNEILSEEFLNKVVSIKHEGDTPSRQPEIKRKVLDSLAPREVLLQKFSTCPELITEEEDKENYSATINLSESSFESFRTSSSDFDIGDEAGGTNIE